VRFKYGTAYLLEVIGIVEVGIQVVNHKVSGGSIGFGIGFVETEDIKPDGVFEVGNIDKDDIVNTLFGTVLYDRFNERAVWV
jgi:hypothetical protein